ncbi:MAG: tetratricopeptide repeat protein, partial [Myxococcales bacterium]
ELIKKFPQSRFVPDAYLQMGEHFFNTNQLIKARKAYEEASKTNNGRIKYFAVYKLAWCDFNGGAYEDAIKKFKEVIAEAGKDKSGAKGLKNEALKDIVVSFAQLDAVDEAMTYLKKNTGKDHSRQLIAKLAGNYQEAGKHEMAIKAFRQLLSDDPDHPNSPEYQNSIITSYEGMRKRDMVAKEMRRLVELYRPNTPWAIKNKDNKAAIASAYEITEGAMRTMVTEYHQEAQKTKEVATYQLARDIYKEYLDNFADSEFAYNLRYYYADILWALNEIEAASIQYAKVVETDPQGTYSKAAAYNVLLGYEKLVQAEEGKGKIEELKAGQKIDEKKGKGAVQKTTIKLERHDKDAKAEELTAFQKKLVEAIDKYVSVYPGSEDEISVRYKAAFIYYNKNHDIEAARRFGDIIVKWPTDQWSRKAADLTLDILNKREEWFELNRLAREFNNNKKLTGGDKEFAGRIADLVEASQFKYNYETLFQKEKKAAEAAGKFREFAAEFPKSKYTPQAIVLAMDIHTEARQLDLGIELGEKLLKEYPDSKSVGGEILTPRVLWSLASLYEAISDFKSAAGYYQRFAENYIGKIDPDEKDKKKADAKKPVAVAKKDDKKDGE